VYTIELFDSELMFASEADGILLAEATMGAVQGSELVVTRAVSKTVNPGSNPGSPARSAAHSP
jgi:hypothetical protein